MNTLLAEENAVKNPFASKMGGNSNGNRFQWDNARPTNSTNMSLAELSQGRMGQGAQAGPAPVAGFQNQTQNRPPYYGQGDHSTFF